MQHRQPDQKMWFQGGDNTASWGDELLLRDLGQRSRYTPDFNILRERAMSPVFIYDDCRFGHDKHYLIAGGVYLGKAHTMTDFFTMEKATHYPIVRKAVKDIRSVDYGYIRGEVWGLDVERIHVLDDYYRNGVEHARSEVPMFYEEQSAFNHSAGGRSYLKTWVYMANEVFWRDKQTSKTKTFTLDKGVPERMKDKRFYEWYSPVRHLSFAQSDLLVDDRDGWDSWGSPWYNNDRHDDI